ncbi:hypothetical protein [endosymbiont GvMRE of Glomus versiforme]|uniref:hypothetical protein n=1 Tax=endosymbiont GvMRE of Glomus versiforme TaxID=2039283 RepID=UPI000EEAEC89|nr:hypothetical protein [endosymbiont GvMRE of Glomus versiforme]RHZ35553.1 hypothetical protein GvMRE_IIg27 [endosymbiont GvMRE of Glomus versiforme]
MNELLLLEKDLEEIQEKIHQLELTDNNQDNSWLFWLFRRNDKKVYLERKAVWKVLKVNIERKMSIAKNQVLLIKFSTWLSKTEEKIAKLEAKLDYIKALEENIKLSNYFGYAILIILLVFVLYMYGSGKWKFN